MKQQPTYVGIDVVKARVDVAVRPSGDIWSNDWLYQVADGWSITPCLTSTTFAGWFRRLFLPVDLLLLASLLSHSGSVAGDFEFQDDRVMHDAVDDRCGGQAIQHCCRGWGPRRAQPLVLPASEGRREARVFPKV